MGTIPQRNIDHKDNLHQKNNFAPSNFYLCLLDTRSLKNLTKSSIMYTTEITFSTRSFEWQQNSTFCPCIITFWRTGYIIIYWANCKSHWNIQLQHPWWKCLLHRLLFRPVITYLLEEYVNSTQFLLQALFSHLPSSFHYFHVLHMLSFKTVWLFFF